MVGFIWTFYSLSMAEKPELKTPVTPDKWVVQCQYMGRGLPVLKYLSRFIGVPMGF